MFKEIVRTILKPQEYVDSIFVIDYDSLKKNGIQVLLYDLDNTILPATEHLPSIRVVNLFNDLKIKGFKIALFTNNMRSDRVERIAEVLGVDAYYFVCKPFTAVLKSIIRKDLHLQPREVAFIGDQLFSDVISGNWLELYTILIKNCDNVINPGEVGLLKQASLLILDKIVNK
jgi:HAD superfamily phosphatase (TIGR01668 family)